MDRPQGKEENGWVARAENERLEQNDEPGSGGRLCTKALGASRERLRMVAAQPRRAYTGQQILRSFPRIGQHRSPARSYITRPVSQSVRSFGPLGVNHKRK